ncbi:MAG TPA: DUF1800 domain-containing protein, partial [Anaerolineae bacterium]|nr:DUF1800 domain-containing protein [Anaerolineae bacterium]
MQVSRRSLFNPRDWNSAPQQSAQVSPALHLLNRITWGPRPEEAERAEKIGLSAYLDEQLNPQSIDDSQLEAKLKALPLLQVKDRRALYALDDYEWRVYQTLARAMLRRAIHSKRQLQERMTEFWTDHFNISANDVDYAPDLLALHAFFRQNALGSFRDLLFASAKSPAMLVYLDNFVNVKGAPNENYARELMELHTLGVDGGYTERDIKEVARAFTGWTIHPKTPDGFYFDPEEHDAGVKKILGHTLPAGRGIEDGLHVLSIVANHPSTAQFVCRKLCVRFVSDDPPAALVARLAQTWRQSGGQLRPVLRQLFLSAEFQQSAGQKFRRPLDFLVGVLRASGAEIWQKWVLEEIVLQLGQLPYGWPTPDGYPDTAPAWMSTNGLLARWNTAMRLTHAAYSDPEEGGVTVDLYARIGQPKTVSELVDAVAR